MKRFLILLPAVIFLFLGILTLKDYGTNWDEPYHFDRGQAFLHFFLTGKKSYADLPKYPYLSDECKDSAAGCDAPPSGPSDFSKFDGTKNIYEDLILSKERGQSIHRSFFQSDYFDFNYFMTKDITQNQGGHPPADDVLAALSNFIFYQKLGIMGDIESHHLFEVLSVFVLVVGVAIFSYLEFGLLTSIASSVVLASYPLVFAESHFNIKDPVEMAFFGLSLITFYYGVKKNKFWLFVTSAVFAGLALGTKFNIVFLPFIVVPWLLTQKNSIKYNWKTFVLMAAVVVVVFYAFWPYLWQDPVNNIKPVLDFYFQSGVTQLPEVKQYVIAGFDLFAACWILITTQIPVLVLALVGLVVSFLKVFKGKKYKYLIVLLWFLVPVIRVSLPSTAIHSGVRHIMEFVPGLAILAGIGAAGVVSLTKNKLLKASALLFVTLLLGFSIWDVAKIHPNENVYFNQLVGGLSGAEKKNIPYWGYSYGNVYLQGVEWLNGNADPDSKLSLLLGAAVNVPRLKLRSDIELNNKYWSGPLNKGEYAMEQSYNYTQKDYFRYKYYETFLNPVYELKVDGVAILKIWKNDKDHVKSNFLSQKEYVPKSVQIDKTNLVIDLGREINLTKLTIKHANTICQKQKEGYILTSLDAKNWVRESDLIDVPQSQVEVSPQEFGFTDTNFVFFFLGTKARYITVNTDTHNSCYLRDPRVSIEGLAQ